MPDNRPPPRRPEMLNAPSSEPFYPSFSSAPISSTNYSAAPPVGSGGHGSTESQNPYAGMGYDALPQTEPPPTPTPSPAVHPTQTTEPVIHGSSAPPTHGQPPPPRGSGAAPDHPPRVEDLYRAPGNPYSDHSGRSAGVGPNPIRPTPSAPSPARPGPSQDLRRTAPAKKKRGCGCAVGGLAMLLVAVLIVLGIIGFFVERWEGSTASGDLPTVADDALEEGMCFDTLDYTSGNQFQPVPCSEPHRFEVVQNLTLPGDYPGTDELEDTARTTCSSLAAEVSAEVGTSRISHFALYPSESGWNSGDHELTCFISAAGSVRLHGAYTGGDLEVR